FYQWHRRLSTEEGMELLACGLRLMRLLRNEGVTHNDIKPENIFVHLAEWTQSCANDRRDRDVTIGKFVFADFGCAAFIDKEFPFGNICGTLTLWDPESLGCKYGQEHGFSYENDFFGILGSLCDGVLGYSIIERLLEKEDPGYDDRGWEQYTQLIRKCRKQITKQLLVTKLKEVGCDDELLLHFILQLTVPRENRITDKDAEMLLAKHKGISCLPLT
ncbi:hypothetical protein RFI_16059, partial [Reticulomyxa filosa]